MGEVVAYHRVSTQRQGRSGLGLEAQEAAIARFTSAEGLTVARAFVEVETGRGADALTRRPELRKALAEAKRRKCAVVVAKLDRLSRDVAFIAGLMSKRVPFIVAALGPKSRTGGHPTDPAAAPPEPAATGWRTLCA